MSLSNSWYTLEEAEAKFGLQRSLILEWVDKGVVRAEEAGGKVLRVNVDDMDLKVQEMTGI